MSHIIQQIRKELMQNSYEATKSSGKRYFKEEVKLYGVKTKTGLRIAKQVFKKELHGNC